MRRSKRACVFSALMIGIGTLFGSSVQAAETRVINNSPSAPSICQISPNDRISFGKVVQVINDRGVLDQTVFDQDYTDPLRSMFSENKQRELYLSSWFTEGILLSKYWQPSSTPKWIEGNFSADKYFVRVNDLSFELTEVGVEHFCVYGNASLSRSSYGVAKPVALRLPTDAQVALRNAQKSDKIAIILQDTRGNQTTETEIPIGYGTIQGWKQLEGRR